MRSNFGGGGGGSRHRHLAKPGVSHGQARNDCTVVQHIHHHLPVGCWSCHSGGTIPYRMGPSQSLIAGPAKGAYPTGPAATDAGLLVCVFRRNMSTPPIRQAPTIHGVQLVSPSRLCSSRLSAETSCSWSASFGGILAGMPSPAGGRNDSLAPRSFLSSCSCLAFRAAVPARDRPESGALLVGPVALYGGAQEHDMSKEPPVGAFKEGQDEGRFSTSCLPAH